MFLDDCRDVTQEPAGPQSRRPLTSCRCTHRSTSKWYTAPPMVFASASSKATPQFLAMSRTSARSHVFISEEHSRTFLREKIPADDLKARELVCDVVLQIVRYGAAYLDARGTMDIGGTWHERADRRQVQLTCVSTGFSSSLDRVRLGRSSASIPALERDHGRRFAHRRRHHGHGWQQPATNGADTVIEQVVVYCSVPCNVTQAANGTAATATAGTLNQIVPLVNLPAPVNSSRPRTWERVPRKAASCISRRRNNRPLPKSHVWKRSGRHHRPRRRRRLELLGIGELNHRRRQHHVLRADDELMPEK